MIDKNWIQWFNEQTIEDQRLIALAAVERLMEIDEVHFYSYDPDEPGSVEGLYWESCGEDLRD